MESNTSALELLTSDLTNKDEAFVINKATRDINKNSKSFKDMVGPPLYKPDYYIKLNDRKWIKMLVTRSVFRVRRLSSGPRSLRRTFRPRRVRPIRLIFSLTASSLRYKSRVAEAEVDSEHDL